MATIFTVIQMVASLVKLDKCAKENGRAVVIGSGWIQARTFGCSHAVHGYSLSMALRTRISAPVASMGHSVAAKSIPGVKDAMSLTLPAGYGQHNRRRLCATSVRRR